MDKMTQEALARMENAREVGVLKFPKYIQVSLEDRDLILKALKYKTKKAKEATQKVDMEFRVSRSVPDVVGKEPT